MLLHLPLSMFLSLHYLLSPTSAIDHCFALARFICTVVIVCFGWCSSFSPLRVFFYCFVPVLFIYLLECRISFYFYCVAQRHLLALYVLSR